MSSKGISGSPAGGGVEAGAVAAQLGQVGRPDPGRVDDDLEVDAGQGHQAPGHLLDAHRLAPAHVVDLARAPRLQQGPVGPDHVADVGDVAAGVQVAGLEDPGARPRPRPPPAGPAPAPRSPGAGPGPVWLNGRARMTSSPSPSQAWRPISSAAALLAAYGLTGANG